MREIKFRAWDESESEMALGESLTSLLSKEPLTRTQIDDLILMQYTGLKDKNGIEIYEGDVAIWYVNDVQRIGEIYYTGQAFDMKNDVTGYGFIGWDALRGEIEVIGNIHENPELLEAKS